MSPRYVARHPMTASRQLGDEMIVMSAGDSRLFTLNGVGAVIWTAADGVTLLSEIVAAAICAGYEVDASVALQDAEAFVAELAEHGMMLVSDEPLAPDGGPRP